MSGDNIENQLSELSRLLHAGELPSAAALSSRLLENHPGSAELMLAASQVEQQSGRFDKMLRLAERAFSLEPMNRDIAFRVAECRLYIGDVGAALEILHDLETSGSDDHLLLSRIGEMYVHCGQHEEASRCYQRAMRLNPRHPGYVYNLASSRIAMGRMEEAEQLLNEVIRLDPEDYDAWQNRSTLRKQTADDNHVEQLKFVLEHLEADHPGRTPVCFALARELEDLESFEESFRFLQLGAMSRRKRMQYEVGADVETMSSIASIFNRELFGQSHRGFESDQPVFVLGMPRSGTTLIDRIIASHSQADSLGEINTMAYSVMRTAGGFQGKQELIEKSTRIDFSELGRNYCSGISGFGKTDSRLVDKTPLNFLYIGLIRLAMPNARIVHLRRNPLDNCYAMYKTLFRSGFPFTYSLQDVGRYFIAYRRLMDHWRAVIPGAFLDVDYEKLVTNQEQESRRIIDYLGLDWEDTCLDFHRQSGPAATASAAQVRQPIYVSSVGKWRCYARQLAPLAGKLRDHGIDLD
jgi:tetratricopeptide (TPR) repeat protein